MVDLNINVYDLGQKGSTRRPAAVEDKSLFGEEETAPKKNEQQLLAEL